MRDTENRRGFRPAVRAFTPRELLNTSWADRFKMRPEDRIKFGFQRWILQLALRKVQRKAHRRPSIRELRKVMPLWTHRADWQRPA